MHDPYDNPPTGSSYDTAARGERPRRRAGNEIWIGLALGLLAVAGLAWFLYGERLLKDAAMDAAMDVAPDAPPAPREAPAAVDPDAPVPPQYPVPQPEAAAPALPALAESDAPLRGALMETFGQAPVESFLVPSRIVERIVATVDSLDRDPVPLKTRAVTNVPGAFAVDPAADRIFLGAGNAARYAPLMAALQAADAQVIANLYLRWYPLFQEAYRGLGYPNRHFNDRVVAVIDHLLATPQPQGPVELVRPKVIYQFADPELEQRSSGQKVLLRVGPQNAAAIKAKLKEIRDRIAAGPPAQSG